jgi:hypothetical protein
MVLTPLQQDLRDRTLAGLSSAKNSEDNSNANDEAESRQDLPVPSRERRRDAAVTTLIRRRSHQGGARLGRFAASPAVPIASL